MFNLFNKKKSVHESQFKEDPVFVKDIKELELEFHINNLVICVSNEVENVTVGYGKSIVHLTKAQQPFLVVQDIVNDCEILPMGKIFSYTEQKFNGLNKLEPNERIAIIYGDLYDEEFNKVASPDVVIYPSEVWKQKVKTAIDKWKSEQSAKQESCKEVSDFFSAND